MGMKTEAKGCHPSKQMCGECPLLHGGGKDRVALAAEVTLLRQMAVLFSKGRAHRPLPLVGLGVALEVGVLWQLQVTRSVSL